VTVPGVTVTLRVTSFWPDTALAPVLRIAAIRNHAAHCATLPRLSVEDYPDLPVDEALLTVMKPPSGYSSDLGLAEQALFLV